MKKECQYSTKIEEGLKQVQQGDVLEKLPNETVDEFTDRVLKQDN